MEQNARKAIRFLEQLRVRGSLLEGSLQWLEEGDFGLKKTFWMYSCRRICRSTNQTNRILKVCKGLSDSRDLPVILVTKDILLRIKAQILGIPAEDFTAEQVAEQEDQLPGTDRSLCAGGSL